MPSGSGRRREPPLWSVLYADTGVSRAKCSETGERPSCAAPLSAAAAMREGARLGIDVGSVRVGVAASDRAGLVAAAVETVKRDTRGETDLARIATIAAERHVIEVIVGLPRSLSGQERAAALSVRRYAERLAARIAPVVVRLVDERLTTVSARRGLRDMRVSTRRERSVVDQAAAVIILQTALDMERGTGEPPGEELRSQPS